jgi:hypothetical protein
MQARRAARSSRRPGGPEVLSPAEFDARTGPIGPFKGDRRSDGKFYTGEAYGWQTAPAAARSGLLGSEVLGDAAFARSPGPSAGGGQAPIAPTVTPLLRNSGTGNAAVALQNAAQGVKAQPSWNWNAPENAQALAAAQGAGEAAQGARAAQGGRGYLSGGATPDPSNPASQAFWDRADTQAWEAANPQLAAQLKTKHGFGSQAAPLGFDPGAQTGLDVDPQAQSFAPDANAPAVPGLVESLQARQGLSGGFSPTQTAFSEPTAPTGSDPAQRMAPNQMRSGPETEVDLAQALNTEHLQSIKAALRGNENLTSPSYFQPSDQYQQPSWPWGQR